MRKILPLTAALAVLALAGCTWGIKLSDAGHNVRTAWNGDVGNCRELGKITVSVMDRVGPIDRNDIKVRDELEVMARNEAAKMQADTVKPLGEPVDGEQAWGAYRCGAAPRGAPASTGSAPAAPQQGGAQTFPVQSGGG